MKYEIKNRWDGSIIYQDEAASFKALLEAAVKSRADLSGANLYGADLSGADLSRANLSRANLSRANLSGANLYGADLSRADLSGANLSGANLYGANLYGADLYGYFCFGPGGSRNTYTWARWEEKGYMVHCGCQTVTLDEFAKMVKKTHGTNDHAKWYAANIKTMEIVAEMSENAYRERQAKEKKGEALAASAEGE